MITSTVAGKQNLRLSVYMLGMNTGQLTVLSGPMFAGKTDTFITLASAIPDGDRRVYYPEIDTRYEAGYVTAHNGRKVLAEPIDLQLSRVVAAQNVFIDEAQFLKDSGAYGRVLELVRGGSNVILAGLDLDYREWPFGLMPQFMALSNKVLKITGICAQCGAPSTRTYRKSIDVDEVVFLGGVESYEPRCLDCYLTGG